MRTLRLWTWSHAQIMLRSMGEVDHVKCDNRYKNGKWFLPG